MGRRSPGLNTQMSFMDWLRSRFSLRPKHMPAIDRNVPVPAEIRTKLIPDNPDEPLWPSFRRFGRGRPRVRRETQVEWVVRDAQGRVVGGAVVVPIGDRGFHTIDVAVDPRVRRHGYATQLYEELARQGIDIGACSNASLYLGAMTELGYAFMLGRRRKTLAAGTGPLAERLRQTGVVGPPIPAGWIPPRIEAALSSTLTGPAGDDESPRKSDPADSSA